MANILDFLISQTLWSNLYHPKIIC